MIKLGILWHGVQLGDDFNDSFYQDFHMEQIVTFRKLEYLVVTICIVPLRLSFTLILFSWVSVFYTYIKWRMIWAKHACLLGL